jgi:hypothetical protein
MAIISDVIIRIYFWLLVFSAMFGTLAVFRRTRKVAASGFIYSSYFLGLILWIGCAALVYRTWGLIALLVSILVFGIGPFFSALIISLIQAAWLAALALLGLFFLLIAQRYVGYILLSSGGIEDGSSASGQPKPKPSIVSRLLGRLGRRQQPAPAVAAIFEKMEAFLKNDVEQNAQLPEEVQSQIARNPACDVVPNGEGQFGKSLENPIPTNGPIGEAIYLSSLRINGDPILFHRLGSHSNVDAFEIVSLDGTVWDIMFLSCYFPRRSKNAPAGYQLARDEPSWTRIFGTTARVEPFPHSLFDAVKSFNKRITRIPIANKEIEAAIARHKYVAPAIHRQRVDELVRSRMQLALTDAQTQ